MTKLVEIISACDSPPNAELGRPIAALVAGTDDPSARLCLAFGRARESVRTAILGAEQFGRKELSAELQKAHAAVEAARTYIFTPAAWPLSDLIQDGLAQQERLSCDDLKKLYEPLGGTRRVFKDGLVRREGLSRDDLGKFCDALASTARVIQRLRDSVRLGGGRDKFVTFPAGLTPREAAAAFVSVAWQETHGRLAPHTNRDAHAACEALWRAAGEKLPPRWGDSPTGWRRELTAVGSQAHASRLPMVREIMFPAPCPEMAPENADSSQASKRG